MSARVDALVIGAGPAGSSAAVWLAAAGWQVALVEQHRFPRQKVCGGCLAAGIFPLLDELGVGAQVREVAGAPLAKVGWMDARRELSAAMPPCPSSDAYGRALGRDVLDSILLQRARSAGVDIHQPARVLAVSGQPGDYCCEISTGRAAPTMGISAALIIDAHGSWARGPRFDVAQAAADPADEPASKADLFAFQCCFASSSLAAGCLPVFALDGGYGGMVVANGGRVTVALCLRRDVLHRVRKNYPWLTAGAAVEQHLKKSCPGVHAALQASVRLDPWRCVGPIRPGIRHSQAPGIYRVGNAAGEIHPLVGEGMHMALRSARALTHLLVSHAAPGNVQELGMVNAAYAAAWRRQFSWRSRVATCYAQIAMRPRLSRPVGRLLNQWPGALTMAARFGGKAEPPASLNPGRVFSK